MDRLEIHPQSASSARCRQAIGIRVSIPLWGVKNEGKRGGWATVHPIQILSLRHKVFKDVSCSWAEMLFFFGASPILGFSGFSNHGDGASMQIPSLRRKVLEGAPCPWLQSYLEGHSQWQLPPEWVESLPFSMFSITRLPIPWTRVLTLCDDTSGGTYMDWSGPARALAVFINDPNGVQQYCK